MGRLRRLGGCLLLILIIFGCLGVSVFTLDQLCYVTLSQRLPLYPDAEITVERHNMFRARGMGETYMELVSPDDPDTVSRWYGSTAGRYQREAVRTNDPLYRLATAERAIGSTEDRDGSLIQLYGTCAQ